MHRTPLAALAIGLVLGASACGDSSSGTSMSTPTAQPTVTFTPTLGPSPAASPTSCVGVAPAVEPIDSPTTRSAVRVRGTGVTCGANKRVTVGGPDDQYFVINDCVDRNRFDVEVSLDIGDNTITACQWSLCGSFCTALHVVRRRG